jgi:hypothetical protein
VNLSNHNEVGCSLLADADGMQVVVNLLDTCANRCGNHDHVLDHERFDVLTLGLGVLINGVELSPANRQLLGKCRVNGRDSVWQLLVHLFHSRTGLISEHANHAKHAAGSGGGVGEKGQEQGGRARPRGGRGKEEAEGCGQGEGVGNKLRLDKLQIDDLVIAAYTSLLLGCGIRGNEENKNAVLQALGGGPASFRPCVQVLDYFIVCQTEAEGVGHGQSGNEQFRQSLETVIQELTAILRE